MKQIAEVRGEEQPHWVGDGFPVRTLFSYHQDAARISPFLLLDYGGPFQFEPAEKPRGVEQHPHRGFETVTIVYQGALAHRDSAGNSGTIATGDVQWMTAGSGIVHEEFHSPEFTRQGGVLEMVQLWVNLPAKEKTAAPKYQEILADQIPHVALPGDAGIARVIAGDFRGARGPAATFTPLSIVDLRLNANCETGLEIPAGFNSLLVVQTGSLLLNHDQQVDCVKLVRFEAAGSEIKLKSGNMDAMALLLCGAPITEPIAGRGPFVMNTNEEIHQAIADYQSGKMGSLD